MMLQTPICQHAQPGLNKATTKAHLHSAVWALRKLRERLQGLRRVRHQVQRGTLRTQVGQQGCGSLLASQAAVLGCLSGQGHNSCSCKGWQGAGLLAQQGQAVQGGRLQLGGARLPRLQQRLQVRLGHLHGMYGWLVLSLQSLTPL